MLGRTRGRIAFLMRIFFIVGLPLSGSTQNHSPQSKLEKPAAKPAQLLPLSAPLTFEQNVGQADPKVKFLSRGAGYDFFYTGNEFVVQAAGRNATDTLRLRLLGANPSAPASALNEVPTRTNYFLGRDRSKWFTGIKNYSRLRFSNIYPGIELAFYGNQQRVQHDFVIAPAADPTTIAFAIEGARKIKVARDGDLLLVISSGELRLKKPVIYQTIAGERRSVSGGFVVKRNRVGFRVGNYDCSRELIIDPVIVYGTYLSGGTMSTGAGIAVDAATHDAYVTGTTDATVFAGPLSDGGNCTVGSSLCHVPTDRGGQDVYVAKLAGKPGTDPDPNGSILQWITFFGGAGDETVGDPDTNHGANPIALDSTRGKIYVGGRTTSTDLATTPRPGTYQQDYAGPDSTGGNAGFLLSLNGSTGAVEYATYLSDPSADPAVTPPGTASPTSVNVVGVAAFNGKIAFAANTKSAALPVVHGATLDPNAAPVGFVGVLDPADTTHTLFYSTYFGDDNAGDFFTGISAAATTPPYLFVADTNNNTLVPSVLQIEPNRTSCTTDGICSFTQITGAQTIEALVATKTGDVYATGQTIVDKDGYVVHIPIGGPAEAPVPFGGTDVDKPLAIALDPSGNVLIAGATRSGDLATPNGLDRNSDAGTFTGFLTRYAPDLSTPEYFTYIGGSGSPDQLTSVGADDTGAAYVTGTFTSNDLATSASGFQAQRATLTTSSAAVFKFVTSAEAVQPAIAPSTTVATPSVDPVGFDAGNSFQSTITYAWDISNKDTSRSASTVVFNMLSAPLNDGPALTLSNPVSTDADCTTGIGGTTCVLKQPLAPQATVTLSVTGTTTAAISQVDSFDVNATVSSAEALPVTAAQTSNVGTVNDLTLVVTQTQDNIALGAAHSVTYSFAVTNNGTQAAKNLKLATKLLEAEKFAVTLVGSSAATGDVCDATNGTGCSKIALLGPGATFTYAVTGYYTDANTDARPSIAHDICGNVSNFVNKNPGQPANSTGDKCVTTTLERHANVSVKFKPAPDSTAGPINLANTADDNDTAKYTVEVENTTDITAYNVRVITSNSFDKPDAFTSSGSCSAAAPCIIAKLDPRQTVTIANITNGKYSEDPALVALSTHGTGTATENANLDGGLGFIDDITGDDSDSFQTKLQRSASLQIAKAFVTPANHSVYLQNDAHNNDAVEYAFTLTNSGPNKAVNVSIENTNLAGPEPGIKVPTGFAVTGITDTNDVPVGQCTGAICKFDLVPVGSTTYKLKGSYLDDTIKLPLDSTGHGRGQETHKIAKAEVLNFDAAAANSTAISDDVAIERKAQLQVELKLTSNPAGAAMENTGHKDDTVSYSIKVTNLGPNTSLTPKLELSHVGGLNGVTTGQVFRSADGSRGSLPITTCTQTGASADLLGAKGNLAGKPDNFQCDLSVAYQDIADQPTGLTLDMKGYATATEKATAMGVGSTPDANNHEVPLAVDLYRVAPLTINITPADADTTKRPGTLNNKLIGVDSLVRYDVTVHNAGPNVGFMDSIATVLDGLTGISVQTDLPGGCNTANGSGCENIPPLSVGDHHYIVTGYFAAKDLMHNSDPRNFSASATGQQVAAIGDSAAATANGTAPITLVNTPRTCTVAPCTGDNLDTALNTVVVRPAIGSTTTHLPLVVSYKSVTAAGITEQSAAPVPGPTGITVASRTGVPVLFQPSGNLYTLKTSAGIAQMTAGDQVCVVLGNTVPNVDGTAIFQRGLRARLLRSTNGTIWNDDDADDRALSLSTAQRSDGRWNVAQICGNYTLGFAATNFFALQEPVNNPPVAAVTDGSKNALLHLGVGNGGTAAQGIVVIKANSADPTNPEVKFVADPDNLTLPGAPAGVPVSTGACPPDTLGADSRCDLLTYTLTGPVGMNPSNGSNQVQFSVSAPGLGADQLQRGAAGGLITWNTADGVPITFDPATGELRFPVTLQGAGNLALTVSDELGASSQVIIPFSVGGAPPPAPNPTSATITAGGSVSFAVDTDSKTTPGFTGNAVFICTPSQQMSANGISCSFLSEPPKAAASGSNATVRLDKGVADVQLSLLINTTAAQVGALMPQSPPVQQSSSSNRLLVAMLATTGLPVFGVVLVAGIRRRNWKLVLLVLASALVVVLSACGGVNHFQPNNNPNINPTQAGTYQVSVSVTYTPDPASGGTPFTETRTYTITVK